jgi:hypothetical protein
MEKRALIQWNDGTDLQVLIGIGEWDGKSNDEHIFYWMHDVDDYQVGYRNGDGWTIIQIEKEESNMAKWNFERPTTQFNGEQVVIGLDHCNERSDFNIAVIQFVQLYDGSMEAYYHVSFKVAFCYSVAAKELLSDSSYTEIYVPGGWGATIVWLPIHHVK